MLRRGRTRLLCRQAAWGVGMSGAQDTGNLSPQSERNQDRTGPTPPSTWGSSKGKWPQGGAFPFAAWLLKGAEWAAPHDSEDALCRRVGGSPGELGSRRGDSQFPIPRDGQPCPSLTLLGRVGAGEEQRPGVGQGGLGSSGQRGPYPAHPASPATLPV